MDQGLMKEADAPSAIPGLSRRDFLGYCAKIAGLLGLSEMAAPKIAHAVEKAPRPSLVWSAFQRCTGCTVSLVQNVSPGPAELILNVLSLDYIDTVMAAAGDAAEKSFDDAVAKGDFFYVIEGGIPAKIPMAATVAGKTAVDIVKETAPKAKAVVAIGNCAAYGGIQAADPNPTGCVGVVEFFKKEGIDKPVINIPTCPGNADMMVAALVYFLFLGKLPQLDAVNRPVFLYGETIHDNCERRGHFENGEFVEKFGDKGEALGWCLFKVGCKGPGTYAPCSKLRWNNRMSWCVAVGPCIGCAEPGFWDNFAPYYEQLPGVAVGMAGVSADTVGKVLGGAAVVGLGAHFVGQAATGRLGKGGPPEDEGKVS